VAPLGASGDRSDPWRAVAIRPAISIRTRAEWCPVVDSPPLSLLALKKGCTSCADPITLKSGGRKCTPLKDSNLSAIDQQLPTGPRPFERVIQGCNLMSTVWGSSV
jgi:hypothetical protein